MRKRPINIIGGFYKDPNLHWSRQDTLNWIPVAAEREGTLSPYQLRDAPGVKPFVRITRVVQNSEDPPEDVIIDVGPIRGMRNVEGKLFVVAAQTVYQISNAGVAIPVGPIPGVGRVSMAHNQYGLSNQLIIVNGSAGYIVNTSLLTVEKITDEGYPGAFVADFMDQYLVQVEPQGRFWFHSDLADGLAYSTLDRYEAESDPDRIVSLIRSNTDLFVFGKESTDIFVNTGEQTGTFASAPNTGLTVGCSAKFTPRRMANSIYWLDDKRIVRRLDGYTDQRISTEAIDSAFSECTDLEISQAYGFTWETQGHKVYYITVPGRFTFGYDILTQQWHRRSTWNLPHWDVVDAVFWNGVWIVGSGQNGRLYELDQFYKLDRCDPLVRKRVTGKLWDAENEMTLNNVELKFNTGGPVSVCVPFPVQPEGPTLSGDAPAGTVDTPYTFTYTATPGDSPIVRTVVMPGSTDIAQYGLTWNQVTATISGDLTRAGTITLNLRTYDEVGLFDDHTDTIPVAYFVLATRINGGTAGSYMKLDASLVGTWTADTALNSKTGYQLALADGRVLIYRITGNPVYTDNYGVAFSNSTGSVMGSGGSISGWHSEGVTLIAGGSGLIRRSLDNGATFATITSSPAVNYICRNEMTGRWIAVKSNGDVYYSDDEDGETWTLGTNIAGVTASSYASIVYGSEKVFFGCSNGAATTPVIVDISTGEASSTVSVPAFPDSSDYITAQIYIGDRHVIATEKGSFASRVDEGAWEVGTDSAGCHINQMSYNGRELVIIAGIGGDPFGRVLSTMDYDTLTVRMSETLPIDHSWIGITT